MVEKHTKTSETYRYTGYSTDDDLAEQFSAFEDEFESHSKAVMYCVREQMQREEIKG